MPRLPALADLARVGDTRLPEEPACPATPAGVSVAYLLDASTGLEDRLLRSWAERCGAPPNAIFSLAPSRLHRRRRTDPAIEELATEGMWLIPLRIVWMPGERNGRRIASWIDVVKLGDPRDPRWGRDYLILRHHPDRVRIVVGAGASGPGLSAAHARSVEHRSLADFVTRRAWRSLDRAEREVRGNRYKVPKFVAEDIAGATDFRQRAIELGRARGLPETVAVARARYYLAEIAANHSPLIIDLVANLIHWVYRRGYGAIRYDPDQVAAVARLGHHHPVVFLPSHRSNLDRLALQFMLWENDLPPNHTAGGINMNFFPIGPLIRRTGVFFIRRTFKDNELYKFVVKTYLDYLIERRFPLEWYLEGGRSRSGKLRPPRLGMLAWVVDSFHRGKADDVYLLPVSIAYDKIQDVDSYAAEAIGGSKDQESFSWALQAVAGLRRRYGDIHISFAEPISLIEEMDDANLDDDDPIEIQKLAFEVMHRIGEVTPITPTAVVTIALLAARGRALSTTEVEAQSSSLAELVERRGLPTTADLPAGEEVETVLTTMADHSLVSSLEAPGERLWWMESDEALRASYYSNMVVHYFVPRAMAEIALKAPHLDAFWSRIFSLRDLLKFEFFFAEKKEFREDVAAELSAEFPGWEEEVDRGDGPRLELSPATAAWAIVPLLEAYAVVADELEHQGGIGEKKEFLAACLERGRRYRLQGRLTSDAAVSQVLYEGALRLAANRGLKNPDADDGRRCFAQEVWDYLH